MGSVFGIALPPGLTVVVAVDWGPGLGLEGVVTPAPRLGAGVVAAPSAGVNFRITYFKLLINFYFY